MPEPDFTDDDLSEPEETDDYELMRLAGLGALADAIEAQRRDSKGALLPLFSWRPLCEPWSKEGNLTYQKLVPHCTARIKIVAACNRGGKTLSGGVETVGRARGQHPLFSNVKYKVPQNIWVGCNPKDTRDMLRFLVAMTPPNDIDRVYYGHGEERIEFKNGSIIKVKSYGMPREEWQREEVNFLWLDEEPWPHIWEEAMARLNAPDSQCLITATLLNASPFLFDIADGFTDEAKNSLTGVGEKLRVSWFNASMYDNPTLPEDYIKSMEHLNRRNPEMFKIRILGIPTELAGSRIFKDVLQNVHKTLADPIGYWWFGDRGKPIPTKADAMLRWDVWEMPRPNMRYVIGSDLAEGGMDGDWTTAHVICVDTSSVVAKFRGKIAPGHFGKILAYAGWWYNTAAVNWEWNGQGAAVGDRLNLMKYKHICHRESFDGKVKKTLNQVGFRTGEKSKETIIADVRDALGDEVLILPDEETYTELADFGYIRDPRSGRSKGMGNLSADGHDDLVISLAIAWYSTRFARPPKSSKYHPQSWGEEMFMEWEQSQKKSRRRNGLHRGVLP